MSRFLALDLDPSGPLVATATVGRGGIKLERVLAWSDGEPPPADGPATLGRRLKELLKAERIAAAPVLVVLPRDKVVLKDVRYPKTPPAQEPLVVRFQAKKELAGSENDVLMDYLPVPAPSGAEDRRATVVFVNKQVYADVLATCEAAGLKLAAVTPRQFAVAAAYRRAVATAAAHPPEDPAQPVAVLSLTDRGGEFTVVHGGQVPFTRTVSGAAVASETALVGEVKRNLAMFATQSPGAGVQAVYLTEGATSGRGWAGRLQAGLPVPVYPFDPTAGADGADDLPEASRGRFVGVVGMLALRGESEKLPINFVSPRAPKAEPSKARTGLVLGGLLLVALLAGGGVFGYWTKTRKQKEVEKLQRELADVNDELEAASYDKKRLAALDDFKRRTLSPLDVFYDMAVEIPTIDQDKMQLLEYTLKAHKSPLAKNAGVKGPLPPPIPGPGAPKANPTGPAPLPGSGGPLAKGPPAAKPEEKPTADLSLLFVAKDAKDVQDFADKLRRDKHFTKVMVEPKGIGAGDRAQYEVKAELMAFTRKDFTRKLNAEFPKPPKADPDEPPAADPVPNPFADPFADPFNNGGNTP